MKDNNVKPLLKLYDQPPEILASDLVKVGVLALFFQRAIETEASWALFSPFAIFWITLAATAVWAVSYRFNLSKGMFLIVFFGTVCIFGIPAILEAVSPYVPSLGWFQPYHGMAAGLGSLAPQASSGAYAVFTIIAAVVWSAAWLWARWMRPRVHLTQTHLVVIQPDGKQDTHELIGLHMEEDPFDYSEVATHGAGSVALKTRSGKVIVSLSRVIGLYWCITRFWLTPKKTLIDHLTRGVSSESSSASSSQDDVYDAMDDEPEGDGAPGNDGDDATSRKDEIR